MRRAALICALVAVMAAVLVAGPLRAPVQTALLLADTLPQSPVKPLRLFGSAPRHELVRLETPNGPAVADLWVPSSRFGRVERDSRPGLVLALGVTLPKEEDRRGLRDFADSLARLGFVVLWPRLEAIDQGAWLPEQPEAFVAGVSYLRRVDEVDPGRVSLLGFSVGASIALVAASRPEVAEEIRAVVSFGGYHDVFEYLVSLATRSVVVDGQTTEWQPSEDAVRQVRAILGTVGTGDVRRLLEAQGRQEAENVLRSAPAPDLEQLRRLSPAEHLSGLRARVFILHDRGDPYVPYAESLRLQASLPVGRRGAFLLSDLFQHAQPRGGFSWAVARDVANLSGFVQAVLRDL